MSQQPQNSRRAAYGAVVAAVLLLGAGSAQAQWAAKPAPTLPRSVLDQGVSGSVVLNLVLSRDGRVSDAQIVRSSGVTGLDQVALEGAMKWRLDPNSIQASDLTAGRRHMIKFYQDARVSRRVEPYSAFWREL